MKRFFLPLSWVLLIAAPTCPLALAQSPSEDDLRTAQSLLEKGWLDMAETAFQKVIANGPTGLRRDAERGLADVLTARAKQEPDPEKRAALFEKALAAYRRLATRSADPLSQIGLADVLRQRGDWLSPEPIPGAGEPAQSAQAFGMFEQADGILEKAHAALGRATPTEEVLRHVAKAEFDRADLRRRMADTFPGDEEKRRALYARAMDMYEDFIWNFEDTALAYLAYIGRGKCALALRDVEGALRNLQVVLDLPRPEPPAPDMARLRDRLRIEAHCRVIAAYLRAGHPDKALAAADEMDRQYPGQPDSGASPFYAKTAVLLRAKALAAVGRKQEASQVAVGLVGRGAPWDGLALEHLADWGDSARDLAVRICLLQAAHFETRGDLDRATAACKDALSAIDTAKEEKTMGVEAWRQWADLLSRRGLIYAAALAYARAGDIAEKWIGTGGDPDGMETAARCEYLAWTRLRQIRGRKRDPSLDRRIAHHRHRLLGKYGETQWAKRLGYGAALSLLREGQWEEAARLFETVEPDSPCHAAALAGLGQALLSWFEQKAAEFPERAKQGRYDELLTRAAAALLQGVEKAEPGGSVAATAAFTLGRVRHAQRDPQSAATALLDFERRFPSHVETVRSALYLRLRVETELSSLDKALSTLEGMKRLPARQDGSRPFLADAHYRVGDLCGRKGDALEASDPLQARSLLNARADHLYRWLDLSGKIDDDAPPDASDGKTIAAVAWKCLQADRVAVAERLFSMLDTRSVFSGDTGLEAALLGGLSDARIALRDWSGALKALDRLCLMAPSRALGKQRISVRLALGDAYHESGNERGAVAQFDLALKELGPLLENLKPGKRDYWALQLQLWELLFRKGHDSDVVNRIRGALVQYPSLDGKETVERSKALMEQAKRRAK